MKRSRLALNSAAVLGASLCWLPNLSAQTVIFPGETVPTNQPNGSGGQWGNGYNTITSVVITTGYEDIQSAANAQSPAVANAITAPAIFIQINVDPITNGAATDITSGTEWYADYDVAMETSSDPTSLVSTPSTVTNPYGNPFGISTGENYYINGFNDKTSSPSTTGGNQVYQYSPGGNSPAGTTPNWNEPAGVGTNYNVTTTVITPTSITYGIPLSDLGLSAGNSFKFDAYSGFGGLPYGALDNSTFAPAGYYPYSGGPSPEATAYDSATEPGSTLSTYNVGAPTLTWNNTAPAGTVGDGVTWINATNSTTPSSLQYNWNNGIYADYYVDGSNVIFNDVNNAVSNDGTNASAYSVILNSTVNPGSVTFNNSLGNYTLSGTGSIAGTASLTKTGTGTLILSTVNAYSGGTILNAGVLNFAALDNLGTGPITFTGGTLQYATGNTADISGVVVTLGAGGGTINTNGNNNVTFANAIGNGGAGGLTKAGAGTLTLSAADSYTGSTTVSAGTLRTANNNAISAGPLIVNSPGLLDLDGFSPSVGNLSGSGTVDNVTAAGTPALTINTSTSSSFSGVIKDTTGSVSLHVSGTGTQTLSGVNTYTGGTTVSSGELVIAPTTTANMVALPNGAVSIGAAGKLQLADNASASTPLVSSSTDISNQLMQMSSLSITAGGVLDVRNNHFYVADPGVGLHPDDSTYKKILGYVANGVTNPTGGEITSTEGLSGYGVGIVDGNDGVLGTPVSANQIEVAYTLEGDANLDGKVDITDFNIFAPNFGLPTTLGWEAGDFNYSGTVDIGDFNLFAGNFGLSDNGTAISMPAADYAALDAFAAANGLSLTSVPEPASLGLLLVAGAGILSRRRRNQ